MNKFLAFVIFTLLAMPLLSEAQTKWANQYEEAKKYIDENRYEAALEILTPLIKEEKGNDYVLYSRYLYAFCNLKQNKLLSSRDMLLQLKQQNAHWSEIDKVNGLLATVYMKLGEYRKSIVLVRTLPAKFPYLSDWKKEYYVSIQPLDTIIAIQKTMPYDVELAEELYRRLSNAKELTSVNKSVLFRLEKEYGFTSNEKKMVSVVKDQYNVAILFPFQIKETDATANMRSNQYIYDMYAGIKIAIDTLNKKVQKAPIKIHAYDTEKDINKVTEIVRSKEWEAIDLVVGPIFPEQYTYLKDLPEVEGKVMVNPISSSLKYADKEGTYLYKPSIESYISAMVNYATANFVLRKNVPKDSGLIPKKNVAILYGKEIKDSVMAHLYRDSIISKGFTVKHFYKVDVDYMGALRTMVSDSVGLLKISHISTFASDPVFAANFISLMEGTQQYIPVYAYSDWLNNTQLSYPQMETRGVYFIHPEYLRLNSETYKKFHKAYVSKFNVFPSIYVIQGYEMMLLLGESLRDGGTDISVALNKKQKFSLGMMGGYDYSNANYNKYVPIVAFKNMKLNIVNEAKDETKKSK